MAALTIQGSELVVTLSMLEKLGALHGDVRVPLTAVTGVRLTDTPYAELRGLRVGTGVPFVIVLGRMLFRGGQDFVALYGRRRTAVIDLAPGLEFSRLLISEPDEAVVRALRGEAAA